MLEQSFKGIGKQAQTRVNGANAKSLVFPGNYQRIIAYQRKSCLIQTGDES